MVKNIGEQKTNKIDSRLPKVQKTQEDEYYKGYNSITN